MITNNTAPILPPVADSPPEVCPGANPRDRVVFSAERSPNGTWGFSEIVAALVRCDATIAGHGIRVARVAVLFGEFLGLSETELLALQRGAVLHDVGKLHIPSTVLTKPGPLTETEWDLMKRHPHMGVDLCQDIAWFRPVEAIVRYHHERWDGSGYPDGLSGEAVPLCVRVVQLVDIYDALANRRPYKEAMSTPQIIDELLLEVGRGWRDPRLTLAFIDLLQRTPQPLWRTRSRSLSRPTVPAD